MALIYIYININTCIHVYSLDHAHAYISAHVRVDIHTRVYSALIKVKSYTHIARNGTMRPSGWRREDHQVEKSKQTENCFFSGITVLKLE